MSATHEIPQPQLDRLQEQLDELFDGGGGGGEDPRVDGLIREVRALAQTVNGQSTTIANLQQSVSQLNQTVSGQTSDISDLESSVSQLTQIVTSQGAAIGSVQSDVSQLNSDVSSHSASIGLLQTNLSQLTQTVSGQSTDISGLQLSVSQLTQTVESQGTSIGSLQTSVSGLSTDLSDLQTSFNAFKNLWTTPQTTHWKGDTKPFNAPFNNGPSGIDFTILGKLVIVRIYLYLPANTPYVGLSTIVQFPFELALVVQFPITSVDSDGIVGWGTLEADGKLRLDKNLQYNYNVYVAVASFPSILA